MREVKTCEKCGEKLDVETGLCPVCDFETLERVVRTRNPIVKIMPAIYVTFIIVLALIIARAWSNGDATYDKFAQEVLNAYFSNDTSWIDDNKSSIFEYANNIESGESLEYINSTKEDIAKKINTDIGVKGYSINWVITDISDLPEQAIDKYNNMNPNSGIFINKIKQMNVKVTAQKEDKTSVVDMMIRISHENNSWRLLSIMQR